MAAAGISGVIPMDLSRHDARGVRRQSRLVGRNWDHLCSVTSVWYYQHRGYVGGGVGPL